MSSVCISEEEFQKIQYGDHIELFVHNRIIQVAGMPEDLSSGKFEWFKSTNLSSSKEYVSVILSLPTNYTHWVFTQYTLDLHGYTLGVGVDPQLFGGWHIFRMAIRGVRKSIQVEKTSSSPVPDAIDCVECWRFYPMAEPNFGDKLVCFSCRDSLQWKYVYDKQERKVSLRKEKENEY